MMYSLANIKMKNYLVASSSPLTESNERLCCCYEAGFSGAILKSASKYVKTGTGYGRKIVYANDGYYADASFEREILTLEEGLELYKTALKQCPSDMVLIPSVSASSLNSDEWILPCRQFEKSGAKLLQLDFFYLGTLIHDDMFFDSFYTLLVALVHSLNCTIMPKLNVNFDPVQIFKILKECGVNTVSLLDSMREDPDQCFGLHKGTTSYFGHRQLPYTLEYLKAAKEHGLEVCAGGGITSKKDVDRLLYEGADMIQTASYVLTRGFSAARTLLDNSSHNPSNSKMLEHNPWCDFESRVKCENCGACINTINEGLF